MGEPDRATRISKAPGVAVAELDALELDEVTLSDGVGMDPVPLGTPGLVPEDAVVEFTDG